MSGDKATVWEAVTIVDQFGNPVNLSSIGGSSARIDPFTINGNGFVIVAGERGNVYVTGNCNIIKITATADVSGSISIQILKTTFDNYPTTSLINTISISGSDKAQNTGLSIPCNDGDIIRVNVTGTPTNIKSVSVGFTVEAV